ncbi:MAG: SGNH/GDSL hydrolase family protein, partial [Betaproteobacteria bacterium]|nr:SGNH/GDSL hydrolase family protein [Betaproteobacteria bacterium]
MADDHVMPAVLAIGDSWFWYPIGQSLLDPINTKVWNKQYCIYAIGANGAEARDYVEGKFRNI